MIYDSLAKRYHYTIDDFYKLTMRQIQYLTKIADDGSYEEFSFNAALHRMKLKPRIAPLQISKKDRDKMDQDAEKLQARMQQRYEDRKKKDK